jgi:hypothetical protein
MLTALFLAESRYRRACPQTHHRRRKLGGRGDHIAEPLGICDPGCAPATPDNLSRIVDFEVETGRGDATLFELPPSRGLIELRRRDLATRRPLAVCRHVPQPNAGVAVVRATAKFGGTDLQ